MRKALNIIIVILDVLLLVFLAAVKIDYYVSDRNMDMLDISIYDIVWIPISMLITLFPMICQVGLILFLKFKKQLFAFVGGLFFWAGDLIFEFISLLGAAMCLDDKWGDMAMKMMGLLMLFLIPLGLSFIAFIVETVKDKRAKERLQ